jgi:cyclophilin family peptidyl-prolyl cis-trans isomerase
LLIGAIINDISFGRYDDALEIAGVLIDGRADAKHFYALRDSSRLSLLDQKKVDEIIRRYDEAIADDLPRVRLETSKGVIDVELFENEAPGTVGNFVSLVEKGFYNGVKFHRVIDGFVAQGGDPKGDGTGGPGYKIKDETNRLNARQHFRGYLSMANSGPNSGGSQFFIIYSAARTSHLNGKHTVFGRVISGMDVVDKLTRVDSSDPETKNNQPDVIVKAEVLRKREHAYAPDKVAGSEETE